MMACMAQAPLPESHAAVERRIPQLGDEEPSVLMDTNPLEARRPLLSFLGGCMIEHLSPFFSVFKESQNVLFPVRKGEGRS